MFRKSIGFLILIVCGAGLPAGAQTVQGRGWPMKRHDVCRTARSPLKSNMISPPVVAWQYDNKTYKYFIALPPTQTEQEKKEASAAPLPRDYYATDEGKQWTRLGDDEDQPGGVKAAKLIPESAGVQTVEWITAAGSKAVDTRQAVCFTTTDGKKKEEWRSESFEIIQNINHIFVDVDGDGSPEVVIAPHYRIIILDGKTGKTRQVLKIHDHRNYGFFCAANIDDDPYPEFVVIADFAMHLDVIDNDGKEIKLLWRRDLERDIQSKHTIIRPGSDPVLDINGDGKKEILFNYFNESGDERWHVAAFDAISGEKAVDLPSTYLDGAADINGDGRPELFCCATTSLFVPDSGDLTIVQVDDSKPKAVWEKKNSKWVAGKEPFPLTHSTIIARGDWNITRVPSARQPLHQVFFIETEIKDGKAAKRYLKWLEAESIEKKDAFREIGFEPLNATGHDELSVVRYSKEEISGRTRVMISTTQPIDPNRAKAKRVLPLRDKGVVVSTQGAETVIATISGDDHVIAVSPPSKDQPAPKMKWKIPGAGPPVIADIRGKGAPSVVCADWSPQGEGRISACSLAGALEWSHVITGFPGPYPEWNFGGVTTWSIGRFSDAGRTDATTGRYDVWASARRSTMHSDEGWVLSTDSKTPIWHRREVRTNRTGEKERGWGCGGSDICAFDVTGDGYDEVVSLYPVNYMAANGRNGELVQSVDAAAELFKDAWGAYCKPVIMDFNGDGREELLWAGPYHIGLTTLDGKVLWHHPGAVGPATAADIDGDGKLEIGSTGGVNGKGLEIWDAATGEKKMDLAIPANIQVEIAACDIDGDGTQNFLFSMSGQLYAIYAVGGKAAVLWTLQLPSPATELTLADVDQDGLAEILYMGDDSVLYCLDSGR